MSLSSFQGNTSVEDKVQIVTILKDKSEQINTIDQIS